MWRNLARQASSRKFKFSTCNFLEKITPPGIQSLLDSSYPLLGFRRTSVLSSEKRNLGQSNFPFGVLIHRSYASAADAIASESELLGSEEVLELVEQFHKQGMGMVDSSTALHRRPNKMIFGMGSAKYCRQIKMETEAWEQTAKEYQELLAYMCEQKLVPNLPYVKSLFLGWFEPLRDAIAKDQKAAKARSRHMNYEPYFDELPADKMAVIAMHKLVGLLMTNAGEIGCVTVVQAACQIGEAIENEARIQSFLKNTRKKNLTDNKMEGVSEPVTNDLEKQRKEQEKLRKRGTSLIKKQKLKQVRGIVKGHVDSKPWGWVPFDSVVNGNSLYTTSC